MTGGNAVCHITDVRGNVMYLSEHLGEVLGGGVVASLLEVGLDLVLDLGLVQVPRVLLLGVLARRRVWGPGNLKKKYMRNLNTEEG